MVDGKLIIGISGPFQAGKTELRHVFEDMGACFLNLNDLANQLRAAGSAHRWFYEELGLGSVLPEDGRKHAAYYLALVKRPDIHQQVMDFEAPHVTAATWWLLGAQQAKIIVLSWEYLHLIMDHLPLNYVIGFEFKQAVWLTRLKTRAMKRGWQGDPPTSEQLLAVADAAGMDPDLISGQVRSKMDSRYVPVDTSAADWGEAELRATFHRLGW